MDEDITNLYKLSKEMSRPPGQLFIAYLCLAGRWKGRLGSFMYESMEDILTQIRTGNTVNTNANID